MPCRRGQRRMPHRLVLGVAVGRSLRLALRLGLAFAVLGSLFALGGSLDGLGLLLGRRLRDGREHGLLGIVEQRDALGSRRQAERRRVSPICSSETSNSRCSGTSIGSASTFTSFVTWVSTPPSFTPTGSPYELTGTVAWIGWSSRTSWRSTCVIGRERDPAGSP